MDLVLSCKDISVFYIYSSANFQVVAVAVFLALGFAFYVFFAPFVGKRLFQYIAMGLYTPLVSFIFFFLFLNFKFLHFLFVGLAKIWSFLISDCSYYTFFF